MRCRKLKIFILKVGVILNKRVLNDNVLEIRNEHGETLISFFEEMNGNVMFIKVIGEIKNEVSHDFEDEIMAAFSVSGNIKIDLSETTHISSLAMKSLLSVQQIIDDIPGSSMVISALSNEVEKMFEESGFIDILYIEKQ